MSGCLAYCYSRFVQAASANSQAIRRLAYLAWQDYVTQSYSLNFILWRHTTICVHCQFASLTRERLPRFMIPLLRLLAGLLTGHVSLNRHLTIMTVGGVAQWLGRRSLAGGLSLITSRLIYSWHVTTSWKKCPLWDNQSGQLSFPSLRGR